MMKYDSVIAKLNVVGHVARRESWPENNFIFIQKQSIIDNIDSCKNVGLRHMFSLSSNQITINQHLDFFDGSTNRLYVNHQLSEEDFNATDWEVQNIIR